MRVLTVNGVSMEGKSCAQIGAASQKTSEGVCHLTLMLDEEGYTKVVMHRTTKDGDESDDVRARARALPVLLLLLLLLPVPSSCCMVPLQRRARRG